MTSEAFDAETYKPVHLTCRTRFLAANGITIRSGDHDGFTIKTFNGERRTFLLLQPGCHNIDVTIEVKNGLVWIPE
jgi:hypothetical protein